MSAKTYKWIFFDADNTLFDFDTSSILAFEALVNELNIPSQLDLYAIYKEYNSLVWQQFEQGKIDAEDLKVRRFELFFKEISFEYDGLKANNKYLNFLVENVRLISGAEELLHYIKKEKIKMLIITNGLKEVQKPRLKKVNLTHYFEDIIVSDEIGVAKPATGFFEIAHKAAHYPNKKEVLIVGDSLNSDIRGGNLYGYDTCWYNPERLKNEKDIKPIYEIASLEDLHVIL